MLLDNYEEYARHTRLYTGIHALKPKSKFKTGAITKSTTGLKVDQTNTTVCIIDPKIAVSGAVVQTTPLAPTLNTMKGASGQEPQPTTLNSVVDISSASTAAPPVVATHKKDGGLVKAQADKKKIDARKKILKRL